MKRSCRIILHPLESNKQLNILHNIFDSIILALKNCNIRNVNTFFLDLFSRRSQETYVSLDLEYAGVHHYTVASLI